MSLVLATSQSLATREFKKVLLSKPHLVFVMSVTINHLLLAEHYLNLMFRLKYRGDLTGDLKRELISDSYRYVKESLKMRSAVEATFGKGMWLTFYDTLEELADEIDTQRRYYIVNLEL